MCKLRIVLLALMLSLPADATFNGFFLGAHLGGVLSNAKHTFTNNASASGRETKDSIGFALGAHAGLFYEIGRTEFILGLELYYTAIFNCPKIDLRTGSRNHLGTVTVDHKYATGAALMFGWAVNPKMKVYLRLGYEVNAYNFKYRNLQIGGEPNVSISKRVGRFAPGWGFKYRINKKWAAGFEHIFLFGKTIRPRKVEEVKDGAVRGFNYKSTEQRFIVKLTRIFHPGQEENEE